MQKDHLNQAIELAMRLVGSEAMNRYSYYLDSNITVNVTFPKKSVEGLGIRRKSEINDLAIELLAQLLEYNHTRRITAKDAL